MRFRKLRIALSIFFAIACVLLLVPWARNYWGWGTAIGPLGAATRTEGFPNWLIAALLSLLATMSLMLERISFSLRTLLIATTLVALGLGMVIYLAR
jgi:hypothetical protein